MNNYQFKRMITFQENKTAKIFENTVFIIWIPMLLLPLFVLFMEIESGIDFLYYYSILTFTSIGLFFLNECLILFSTRKIRKVYKLNQACKLWHDDLNQFMKARNKVTKRKYDKLFKYNLS